MSFFASQGYFRALGLGSPPLVVFRFSNLELRLMNAFMQRQFAGVSEEGDERCTDWDKWFQGRAIGGISDQ